MKQLSNYLKRALLLMTAVVFWASTAWAQGATVTGVVTDDEGEPLIGATVLVKGTTNGTSTDIDGNYSLAGVPAKATLVINYVGYNSQEIKVNGRSKIDVTLKANSAVLDEVVVVGYGQMKRSDLTGAVTSVGEDAVRKSISTSVDQVLQGRAAGVQIQANSGTPGASSSIRIRGTNSLNATNQPIFVIDGVVIDSNADDEASNPLSSINPSDIVSMDVLKDASATAIYGSRASNGVIMITTKRGKQGAAATVTYDGYVGWQEMPKKYEMLNLQEYAAHHNYRADYISSVNKSNAFVHPELLSEGTDWQNELFRKALMTSHNISVSGGTEKITYAFSGGFLSQDGIARNSSFRRVSLRSNLDAQIKSWLRGGVTFSFTESKQNVGTESGTIITALQQIPTVAVTNSLGTFDGPTDPNEGVWLPENPVGVAELITNNNRKTNLRFNTYLEATLYKGLTLKTELSGDYNFNNYYYYMPDYTFGIKTQDTRTSRWTKTNTRYWSWRNILSYNETFNKVHNVNVMLGQEMSHSAWEQQIGSIQGFLTNSTPDLSAGDKTTASTTGSRVESAIASAFGRAFYAYDGRYMATFTLRYDGSSKFAEGKKWGWFPSAAVAWRASGESFLKDVTAINNLKLRAGWGKTGNQNVSDFAYMALLSFKSTPWGTGVLAGNFANPDLTWETTNSYNVGFDLGLLQNRIELVADFYYKKTDNLLLQIPYPAFLGSTGDGAANDPWGNIGSISNKGIEITLNTTNITNRDFQWTSNVTFSLNRNKVCELNTADAVINEEFQIGSYNYILSRTVVGQPIGQFYGYKVIGRFDKPEDFYCKDKDGNVVQRAIPKGNTIAPSSTWMGDYIYQDTDGNGSIDDKDMVFLGNPEPKFTWGFGNSFTYKDFDLNIFFTGSYGGKVLNLTKMRIADPRNNSNILKESLNYAVLGVIDPALPDNDYRNLYVTNASSTTMPAVQRTDSNHNYTWISDQYVEDGSYIRLQNLSFGYTLPRNIVKKAYLDNVRVYFSCQNVFTITKYDGLDPEVGAMYGRTLRNGIDYGRYPSPRIYTFGLNVSF